MKSHWLIQAVVLAAFLFNTASASADSQVEKAFETLKAQRDRGGGYYLDMLEGAAIALDWANSQLTSKGQSALYCTPNELTLNARNYANIALNEFKRHWERYEQPLLEAFPKDVVVDALAYGLARTFPCPSPSE